MPERHFGSPHSGATIGRNRPEKVNPMEVHARGCERLGLDPVNTTFMQLEKALKKESERLPYFQPASRTPSRRHRGPWTFLDDLIRKK